MLPSTENSSTRTWANIAGAIALALWAAESTLVVFLSSIPPLQLIAIVGGIGFLATLFRVAFTHKWSTLRQPPKLWIAGTLSFTLVQACYATAFQYAPPAGVDMIYYLWPIELIIISNMIIGEKFAKTHIVASIIAMAGMGLLFLDVLHSDTMQWQNSHLIGYGLAFVASMAWTCYTVFTRRYSNLSSSMIGGYMGFSSLVTGISHFIFEETVIPTSEQWMLMIFYGTSLVGLAYLLWDYGIKQGHYQTLNVLSYTVPMGALGILIFAGLAEPTAYLLLACACITMAALCTVAAEGSKAYKKRKKTAALRKMQDIQPSNVSVLEPIAVESA